MRRDISARVHLLRHLKNGVPSILFFDSEDQCDLSALHVW